MIEIWELCLKVKSADKTKSAPTPPDVCPHNFDFENFLKLPPNLPPYFEVDGEIRYQIIFDGEIRYQIIFDGDIRYEIIFDGDIRYEIILPPYLEFDGNFLLQFDGELRYLMIFILFNGV